MKCGKYLTLVQNYCGYSYNHYCPRGNLTTDKAIAIVSNMKAWKEKHNDSYNVPPADYTSYAASLQLLKDKGICIDLGKNNEY